LCGGWQDFHQRTSGAFLAGKDDFISVVNNALSLPDDALATELYDSFKAVDGSEQVCACCGPFLLQLGRFLYKAIPNFPSGWRLL
jgi:hypothetical protein